MLTPIFMEYPMGLFMGRFIRELKENARLVGIHCHSCSHTIFPPQALCPRCHAENFKDSTWVEVGPKATIAGLMEIKMPWLNPSTLTLRSSEHPVGVLLVDGPGTSPSIIWHFVCAPHGEKLHQGMRVMAEFKPKEEREGIMEDIRYWVPVAD
jgi:uncharacterized OB-fold protein